MTKAIVIHEYGGPEVLKWEDVEVGDPGPGQVRIRQEGIGLNFRDTYHRSGSYGVPGDKFPAILGSEGAGVIEAMGEGVTGLHVGQRVTTCNGIIGAYSQIRNAKAENVLSLPDEIPFDTAAAAMFKGITAHYLIRQSYEVKKGETILIQAVAGGVGLIMCQWAKQLGATVIGTVGSAAKAEIAGNYGCDHIINYSEEDFAERVREITNGEGVPVVYDGVGLATYEGSLDCLANRGYLIGYGNASGNFPHVDPMDLMYNGSLYFQRASLRHFIRNRAELENATGELMPLLADGSIKVEIGHAYDLKDAAQAHQDLETRKTTGSVIFKP